MLKMLTHMFQYILTYFRLPTGVRSLQTFNCHIINPLSCSFWLPCVIGEASATLPYGNDSSPSQECSNEVKTSIRKMRLFPNTNASPRRHKPSNSRHKMFVKTPTVPGELPKPSSETYIDCWDGDHVRMPCSPSNIYPG